MIHYVSGQMLNHTYLLAYSKATKIWQKRPDNTVSSSALVIIELDGKY